MVFSSTVFLFLFLPLSLVLYYNPLRRTRGYRNGVLLAVSLVFYAWGEPVFVGVMLFSILYNYVCGIHLISPRSKPIAAISHFLRSPSSVSTPMWTPQI